LDAIQDLFCTFKISLLEVFLDQAQGTNEKVGKNAKQGNQVQGK
jgi:hypothetical protein